MMRDESLWIKKALKGLNLASGATVLDLGSGSLKFRTVDQPYIDENIFAPLRQLGIKIIHADKRIEEGVDIIVDIGNIRLNDQYDLVLCNNLLEHVLNPALVAKKAVNLVKEGGYLLVSVPKDYRYHEDPIDTMFRPTNRELETMFAGQRVVRSEIIPAEFDGERCKVAMLLLQKVKPAKVVVFDYFRLRIPWRTLFCRVKLFSEKICESCNRIGIRLWYSVILPVALFPRNCFRKLYRLIKGRNAKE